MFTEALLTTVKIKKQPVFINREMDKDFLMDKDVVHIYKGILLSHKKERKFCHLPQHGWT